MALLPMGPPSTNHRTDYAGYYSGEMQETMFDEPTALLTPEAFESSEQSAYDASAETIYEPAEDFADDIPELISYQSGSGHAAVEPVEPTDSFEPTEQFEPAEPVAQLAPEPEPPVESALPEPAEAAAETEVKHAAEVAAAPAAVLTANDFAALEERVLRAVALVRSERQARLAAEERAVAMEAQLHSFEAQIQQIEAQSPILDRLVQEVESLRIEREQVRQRVERLLGQLDSLEL